MPGSDTPTGQEAELERMKELQSRYEPVLLAKPHVVGVAIGVRQRAGRYTGELALVVMVDQKLPQAQLSPEERVPAEIEGVPVDVQSMGPFTAQ